MYIVLQCGLIIITVIPVTTFMMLSSYRGHYESLFGSFAECRLSTHCPPTLQLSQLTWSVILPVGCYDPHPSSSFIIINHGFQSVDTRSICVAHIQFLLRETSLSGLSRPEGCHRPHLRSPFISINYRFQ